MNKTGEKNYEHKERAISTESILESSQLVNRLLINLRTMQFRVFIMC